MSDSEYFDSDIAHFLTRKASGDKKPELEKKIKITRELLVELFIDKKLNAEQIANKLGLTKIYIQKKLRDAGLKRNGDDEVVLNITKEQLLNLYIKERLSTSKIAEMYGVERSVVVNQLARIDKLK